MAHKLPFDPAAVPVRELRDRLAEIDDVDTLYALAKADKRVSADREYMYRIDKLEEARSDPAEPNEVVVAPPTNGNAHDADGTEPEPDKIDGEKVVGRAYLNPAIAAATVKIDGLETPLAVTKSNRAEIENASVTIGGRTLPLFEIRG